MSAAASQSRAAAVGPLLWSTVGAWALFALVNGAAGGRPRIVLLDVCMVVLTAALVWLHRVRPEHATTTAHVAAALSTLGLLATSWWSGGIDGISWWYFAAVPLFASYLAGTRAGLVWCGIAVVACALATTLHPFDPEFVPPPNQRIVGGVVLILICTAFGWLAESKSEARIDALANAARAQRELLASISHEIRTPLHGVLGIATVLAESELSQDQRQLVSTLRSSGKSLQRIVDDVLDVAQLESGRLAIRPERTDLLLALEDVIDLHAPDAAAKGLALTLVPESFDQVTVIADETRIRQMVSNLVSNAVKFTPTGAVTVHARASHTGERWRVEIRVEDTGPGIPKDRIDRLFTAFDRLDTNIARLQGGTGLGLSLARDLATRMGGRLEAERDRTSGACFVLSLDLEEASLVTTSEESVGVVPLGSVLVIEPDPRYADAARALATCLADVELVVVSTLKEAVASASSRRFDAIILAITASVDPALTRAELTRSTNGRTPIVLAIEASGVGHAARLASGFSGTTLKPLRRARIRLLFDEVSVSAVATPIARRKALLIDDDATNRKILERMLIKRGWNVVAEPSGAAGLARLSGQHFDVVLCDLHMPEMDGVAFVGAARAAGHGTYLVAATASVNESDRARCAAAGFNGFLRKPFQGAELDEVLATASARKRRSNASSTTGLMSASVPLVDPVKWREARELMGDEMDGLVTEHLQSVRQQLDDVIAKHYEDAETERAAHTIASSSLMLGLTALGTAARKLEGKARVMSTEARAVGCQQLEALLEVTASHIRTLDRTPPQPASPPQPSAPASVLEIRVIGHLDQKKLESRLASITRAGMARGVGLVVDCREMTGYDREARIAFEGWARTHRGSLSGIAVLTDNKLWQGVVDAMAQLSGQSMRAFAQDKDARAWLAQRAQRAATPA